MILFKLNGTILDRYTTCTPKHVKLYWPICPPTFLCEKYKLHSLFNLPLILWLFSWMEWLLTSYIEVVEDDSSQLHECLVWWNGLKSLKYLVGGRADKLNLFERARWYSLEYMFGWVGKHSTSCVLRWVDALHCHMRLSLWEGTLLCMFGWLV